jgi:hypothetical protein
MAKVQQKVSGPSVAKLERRPADRIRDLSTLRKRGLDLLASLEATLRTDPIPPSYQAT